MEADWARPQYEPGGGDASVLFVVFGSLPEPLKVSASQYRVSAIPDGVELRQLDVNQAMGLLEPPLGPTLLRDWQGPRPDELTANGCVMIRGSIPDPPDLLYLRNCVGLVTALLACGGRAALNLQSLQMYLPERWRTHIFDEDMPYPRHYVTILFSEDERAPGKGRLWLHTRGLRLFGRPDLSVRNVPETQLRLGAELCNRFIEMLAFGHIIPDGQTVRVEGLPTAMVCRDAGDLEDPDFNNVHVELVWP